MSRLSIKVIGDCNYVALNLLKSDFADTELAGLLEYDGDLSDIALTSKVSFDNLPDTDCSVGDGEHAIHQFDLDDCEVFIDYAHDVVAFMKSGSTIRQYLYTVDISGYDVAKFFAQFGYDDMYTEAKPGDANVRVWVIYNYYGHALYRKHAHYQCEEFEMVGGGYENEKRVTIQTSYTDTGREMVFDTFEDAQEWVDERYEQPYCCTGDEWDSPDYIVVV